MAKVNGFTVVIWEKGGSPTKPRIPYMCDRVNVPCINLVGMAKEEKWVFTRKQ